MASDSVGEMVGCAVLAGSHFWAISTFLGPVCNNLFRGLGHGVVFSEEYPTVARHTHELVQIWAAAKFRDPRRASQRGTRWKDHGIRQCRADPLQKDNRIRPKTEVFE